jgi:hypothetical protein
MSPRREILARALAAGGLLATAAGALLALALLGGCGEKHRPEDAWKGVYKKPTPPPTPDPWNDPDSEFNYVFVRKPSMLQESRIVNGELDMHQLARNALAPAHAREYAQPVRAPGPGGRTVGDHGHPFRSLEQSFHDFGQDYLECRPVVEGTDERALAETARCAAGLARHAAEMGRENQSRGNPYGERFARLVGMLDENAVRLQLAAQMQSTPYVGLYWKKLTCVFAEATAELFPPLAPGLTPGMRPASVAGPPLDFPSPLPVPEDEFILAEEFPYRCAVRNPALDAPVATTLPTPPADELVPGFGPPTGAPGTPTPAAATGAPGGGLGSLPPGFFGPETPRPSPTAPPPAGDAGRTW